MSLDAVVGPAERRPPHNIAHRGSSDRAPENTLLAMVLAVDEDGADGLELDLHRSRDGEVIVLHDPTVDRCTDGRGQADHLDLADLRRLDAGHWFRSADGHYPFRGKGLTIPTLEEVLDRFPGTWLSLDLKTGDPETERRTVELLRQKRAAPRCVLGAEDPAASLRLRETAGEFESFLNRRELWAFYLRHRMRFWWGYRPPARSVQPPFRFRGRPVVNRRMVEEAHRNGQIIRPWTVNDAEEMERLIALGVDGIITDRPATLHAVLGRMGIA